MMLTKEELQRRSPMMNTEIHPQFDQQTSAHASACCSSEGSLVNRAEGVKGFFAEDTGIVEAAVAI